MSTAFQRQPCWKRSSTVVLSHRRSRGSLENLIKATESHQKPQMWIWYTVWAPSGRPSLTAPDRWHWQKLTHAHLLPSLVLPHEWTEWRGCCTRRHSRTAGSLRGEEEQSFAGSQILCHSVIQQHTNDQTAQGRPCG